jgi:hypothetical protein
MDLMAEAYQLAKILDAEFRTDRMSVQCFDLRAIQEVRECIEAGERLNAELPDHTEL